MSNQTPHFDAETMASTLAVVRAAADRLGFILVPDSPALNALLSLTVHLATGIEDETIAKLINCPIPEPAIEELNRWEGEETLWYFGFHLALSRTEPDQRVIYDAVRVLALIARAKRLVGKVGNRLAS